MPTLPRIKRVWLVILLFFLLLPSCNGQMDMSSPAPSPTAPPENTRTPRPASQNGQYNPAIRFEHIGMEHGLSQSSVTAILQDAQGFLWFGTEDGLNRYDGYTFQIHRPDLDNPNAISDRWVTCLAQDAEGNLWVGTRQGGLNRYDPRSGRFNAYRRDPTQGSSLSNDWVRALLVDRRGVLWVGTGRGLDQFDPQTDSFRHFTINDGLAGNEIRTLYEDRLGIIWIGTNNGLNRLDSGQQTLTIYKANPEDPTSLINDQVTALQEDAQGNLWVGTMHGVARRDRYTGFFKRYSHAPDNPFSLADDEITSLYLDHTGGFWVGTANGLDFYNARIDRFVHHRNQPANNNSLSSNIILSLYEDHSNVLWVGTAIGGINKYNRQQDRFTYYRHDPENPNSLSGNSIFPIFAEPGGIVWIGTRGNGLERLNPVTGRFTHYTHDSNNPNSLSSDDIYSIRMDASGMLWVGTARALDRLDPRTGKFAHFRPGPKEQDEFSLSSLPVYSIYEDNEGVLWFGTATGLDQFEPQTGTFIHFRPNAGENAAQVIALAEDASSRLWVGTFGGGLHRFDPAGEGFVSYHNQPRIPNSLANNTIFSIYQDRHNNLWIGTGGGLDRYDPRTNTFHHLTQKDGLPNNVIYGILEDDAGHLWMSTNNGLSRYNPVKNEFRNFTVSDGLQNNEFNMSAYAYSSRGEMYFGGNNGFNAFRPLDITEDTYVPPIVLTSLSIEGRPFQSSAQLSHLRGITLTWPQNQFEFEFAALAYGEPSQNQYAYMLQNFDKDWNKIGASRTGRYTNLPGGEYTLLLNGTSGDEAIGPSPLAIRVTVIPPLWERTWFRLLLGLGLAAVIAAGYRLRLDSVQRRNRALADLVHERTQALEKSATEMDALYQADEKILRAVSINQVFQTLVDVAVNILHADHSLILTWDEEQTCVQPRLSHGFSKKTLAAMKFARGEGIIGKILETGETFLAPRLNPADLRSDLRLAIMEEGIQSFAHLPIVVDGRVVAIFNVSFNRPDAANDDMVRLFTALVQRASLSIANMQLFEQTRELAVIEERNRLARDLHDSAKQKAFAALAQLGTANGLFETNPPGVKPHLLEAENLIYEVLQELSFLIQEIYPIALQEKGLPTTLREYIFEWEGRNDIPVNLAIEDERPLDLGTEQAVYRAIQESLANIARHSRATHVDITLAYRPDHLEVTVADNGQGFDPNQKMRGMGLRSIRERVGSIRGTVQIQSAPGAGTSVWLKVPLKKMGLSAEGTSRPVSR